MIYWEYEFVSIRYPWNPLKFYWFYSIGWNSNNIIGQFNNLVSSVCFSFVAWILTKIFPNLLRAILVHKGQIDVIKRASEVRCISFQRDNKYLFYRRYSLIVPVIRCTCNIAMYLGCFRFNIHMYVLIVKALYCVLILLWFIHREASQWSIYLFTAVTWTTSWWRSSSGITRLRRLMWQLASTLTFQFLGKGNNSKNYKSVFHLCV